MTFRTSRPLDNLARYDFLPNRKSDVIVFSVMPPSGANSLLNGVALPAPEDAYFEGNYVLTDDTYSRLFPMFRTVEEAIYVLNTVFVNLMGFEFEYPDYEFGDHLPGNWESSESLMWDQEGSDLGLIFNLTTNEIFAYEEVSCENLSEICSVDVPPMFCEDHIEDFDDDYDPDDEEYPTRYSTILLIRLGTLGDTYNECLDVLHSSLIDLQKAYRKGIVSFCNYEDIAKYFLRERNLYSGYLDGTEYALLSDFYGYPSGV